MPAKCPILIQPIIPHNTLNGFTLRVVRSPPDVTMSSDLYPPQTSPRPSRTSHGTGILTRSRLFLWYTRGSTREEKVRTNHFHHRHSALPITSLTHQRLIDPSLWIVHQQFTTMLLQLAVLNKQKKKNASPLGRPSIPVPPIPNENVG